jgi:serine/threonine protein kinase
MTIHLYAHRYQSGDLVGCGRMSEVYRGRDLRMGRDVAIKVLRADLARDPSAQSRFRREAQNAASLNHPSIVGVYDTGEEQGEAGVVPYIVMEYVDGDTLSGIVAKEGPLAPRRALAIAAEICAALDFSHRHGVVHRDITPANVMVNRDGAAKVMDFGIARAVKNGSAPTTATTIIGTAQYLSPEQARGDTGDARSDIYSAGCVLYELLCGTPPFTGNSPIVVASQHVRMAARPPSEAAPGLSRDIDALVLKALAKNPQNRYQTADEMRKDIARAMAGRPVLATPVLSSDERQELLRAAPVRIEPARVEASRAPQARVGPSRVKSGRAGVSAQESARSASLKPAAVGSAAAGPHGSSSGPAVNGAPHPHGPALLAPVLTELPPGPDDGRDPADIARTRRRWTLIGIAALCLSVVVAVTLTLLVITAPLPPAAVAVPDLTGMTPTQAVAVLQEKRLTLGTVTQVDVPDAKPGTIVNQRPSFRTQVDQDTPVNIEVDK